MSIPAHYVVYTLDEFDVWQDTGIRGDSEDDARRAWLGDPDRIGMAFDIRLEPVSTSTSDDAPQRQPSPENVAARQETIAKWKAGITPLVRGDR